MSIKNKKWLANHGATIAGIIVAVAQAWQNIDWTTFSFLRDWPKLAISAAIALGGYLSHFKTGDSTNGI